ncbi:MAG: hypothetical protein V9E83_12755 [Baekduia sp.]
MRRGGAAVAAAVVVLLGAAEAGAENTIYTYAGTGAASTTGDGGPAVSATLNQPSALAFGADGSLYVAELGGNVIRKIDVGGTIQAFAGTGSASHTGDGGSASAAAIFNPRDIAFAPDGQTMYIAETGGNTIRRIAADGTITTVVGTGSAGQTGDFGAANAATLSGPQGIGVAANGDLYIADTGVAGPPIIPGNKIRLVTAGANQLIDGADVITTFAGTGGAANNTGDLGPALLATLAVPSDVLPMADGTVMIADPGNTRLRYVDTAGIVRPYSLNGTYTAANIAGDGGPVANAAIVPTGQLISDGAGGVLITESARHRIRRVTASGVVSTIAGNNVTCATTDLCGDYGAAELAGIASPLGVAGSPTGRLYIAEGNRIRVRVYAPGSGGPQGPAGPAGLTGAPGGAGADGAVGAAGSTGAAGAAGQAGAAGAAGPNGPPGPNGADGADGRPGRAGANGANGINGTTGSDGASGAAGSQGEAGPDGPKGESGDPLALIGGTPLVVALPASRIVRRGGRIILRLYVSTGSSIGASAVKDGYVISRSRTFLRAGLKQLDLGRLDAGRYRIVVNAGADGGRTSTDRATLVVR